MPYEAQIAQLARCAGRNHGTLAEVVFRRGNKDFTLIFSDGTEVSPANPQSLEREYSTFAGYREIAEQLGGTHPYSLLAFGYQGTGSECFAAFLRAAGFDVSVSDIENVSPPVRLRRNGSWVDGIGSEGSFEPTAKEVSGPLMPAGARRAAAHDPAPRRDPTQNVRKPHIEEPHIEESIGDGPDADSAMAAARDRVPSFAVNVKPAKIVAHGETGTVRIRATSEEQARERFLAPIPRATLLRLECELPPRSGRLGLGKRDGIWIAYWSRPFRAVICYALPTKVAEDPPGNTAVPSLHAAAPRHYRDGEMVSCGLCGKSVEVKYQEGREIVIADPQTLQSVALKCQDCDAIVCYSCAVGPSGMGLPVCPSCKSKGGPYFFTR
jgi:hypothetical protein